MTQSSQDLQFCSELFNSDVEELILNQVDSQDMELLLRNPPKILTSNFNSYPSDIYEDNMELHNEDTLSLEDIKVLPMVSSTLAPLTLNNVLSNEEYVGPYEFEVLILPNPGSKNPWVYSAHLNKVYMDMNNQFPVDFKLKTRPNKLLFIRTTPQYSAQHYAGEPVCRCIQHDHHADATNKDVPDHVRQHVIRCQNKHAYYVGDSREKQRLSILFPLSLPQAGNESVRELFHFVCKSSCPLPGMNRREVEVIFTLEDEHGEILGRKCLKVRICACPKRDKEKEENEANKSNNGPPRGKKRKVEHPPANPGKVMSTPDDFKQYSINLTFVGKQNLLDVLTYAEKLHMAKAYQYQGHSELSLLRNAIADIQAKKKKVQ